MIKKFRKPYRVKKRKSIFKNRFFWFSILILIVFGGIFYLICFYSFFQIKEIKISGNQKVLTGDLENAIQSQIVRELILGGQKVSTKSIFLTNLGKLNEVILEKFPQISQINLTRRFPDILEAKIEERKPVAIFNHNDKYFFLDKEGIIFEKVLDVRDYLKIKSLNQNQYLNLGERAIKKELLSLILEIDSKLSEDFKIPLEEVLVISDERINAKTLEGWEIYFNPQKNIDWQLTKLKALLENYLLPENRANLEYIELRFGNLAPFKYRELREREESKRNR